MNSDVYFGAYTSAFFVCSSRQFPSEEEAPGVRSFSTVGTGGVRAVRGRIGNCMGLATPVLEWLSSALGSMGNGEKAEGRNVTEERGRRGEQGVRPGSEQSGEGRGPGRGRRPGTLSRR